MRTFLCALLGLLFVSVAIHSKAAEPKGACVALLNAYETASKQASLSWVQGTVENSAPRATLRKLEINNYLVAKQINLTLLIQHKCPVPSEPVGVSDYFSDAMKCASAMLEQRGGKDSPPECDMGKWKRGLH